MGLSHSNLGQLKCVRPPGILEAISAIIIGYIISVYTPLRYHRMRAICSSPGIMYMRSFGSIWLYLQYQFTPSYNIHIKTHYELVNINVYIAYNAFLKLNIYNNAFSCQIVNGLIKSVICNVNIVFNF